MILRLYKCRRESFHHFRKGWANVFSTLSFLNWRKANSIIPTSMSSFTRKSRITVLWTKTESEWVVFTISSSTELIKWTVCKTLGGAAAHTDLPGWRCIVLVWQQSEHCPGAAEDPMFPPGVPRASWDLQVSNRWLSRYLASKGWLSRCRDKESWGQGAVAGSRMSEGK